MSKKSVLRLQKLLVCYELNICFVTEDRWVKSQLKNEIFSRTIAEEK